MTGVILCASYLGYFDAKSQKENKRLKKETVSSGEHVEILNQTGNLVLVKTREGAMGYLWRWEIRVLSPLEQLAETAE